MSDSKIKRLLFLTIFIVSVLPLGAALYFLDSSLKTSLSLGFNTQIAGVLEESADNLRRLRDLDPERASGYRQQFESIQELRHVYSHPELVRRGILDSLRIYFAAGFAAALISAVLVAVVLSRRISSAYKETLDELLTQREKVRYLQGFASWQELAKILAHEIKNPLTPIEVLVSSLDKSYRTLGPEEFASHLHRTQTMIVEELQHLKRTVGKFSDFARLPAAQLARVDLVSFLRHALGAIEASLDQASIQIECGDVESLPIAFDATLFRQALANIVRNGVEANANRPVQFIAQVSASPADVEIALSNDGVPIPMEHVPGIFDAYVSTKSGEDNMGLGLAIVRKILIEHGGDVRYEEREGRPTFVLSLPRRVE